MSISISISIAVGFQRRSGLPDTAQGLALVLLGSKVQNSRTVLGLVDSPTVPEI